MDSGSPIALLKAILPTAKLLEFLLPPHRRDMVTMNFKDPLLQTKYLKDLFFGGDDNKQNNSSIIDLSQESSGTTSSDDDEPLSSLIKTSRKRNNRFCEKK